MSFEIKGRSGVLPKPTPAPRPSNALRDNFAAAALTGILFAAGAMVLDEHGLKRDIAKTAYEMADEMLAAREGR